MARSRPVPAKRGSEAGDEHVEDVTLRIVPPIAVLQATLWLLGDHVHTGKPLATGGIRFLTDLPYRLIGSFLEIPESSARRQQQRFRKLPPEWRIAWIEHVHSMAEALYEGCPRRVYTSHARNCYLNLPQALQGYIGRTDLRR